MRFLIAVILEVLWVLSAMSAEPIRVENKCVPTFVVQNKVKGEKSPLCDCDDWPATRPCKCASKEGGCYRWCNLVGGGGLAKVAPQKAAPAQPQRKLYHFEERNRWGRVVRDWYEYRLESDSGVVVQPGQYYTAPQQCVGFS